MMINWEESGAGDPLIFVHGITEDLRSWDPVVSLLEDRYRCVRLDLRGHGKSSTADDYSALAMAQDVGAVVSEAAIDGPSLLVGHSLGAIVVTAYATQAAVRGIVNIDQSLRLGDFAAALQPLAPILRGPDFGGAVTAVFESLGVDRLPDEAKTYVTSKHREARQEVVLGVWDLVLDSAPKDLTAMAESLLGALKAPYLAVHGSDPGEGYPAWLSGLIPGATVEVWPGDGHYPHLVEPERFATRLAAFIAGC
ncbi:MAG: alpha/beta fold hydrolase [Acidimicrobiales bacterium]